MLQLVITYIWFGATIPEFYLTQFTDRQYPIQILINPVPSRVVASLELDIQKADRYKLEVLKDGGVYSDFDNRIDYECLMKKIEEVESDYNNETVLEMLVMRYEGQHW
jgi:mannosyltransferase OCH1-like enzyme